MWTFLLIAVPLSAALVLWFTVWAERRIDAPRAVPAVIDGSPHPAPGSLAYVLVQAAPGHAQDVASHAASLPWVQETGVAQGPYDVIVRVAAGSPPDAHAELARLAGVLRVLPCRTTIPVPAAVPAAAPISTGEPAPARTIVLPGAEPETKQQIPVAHRPLPTRSVPPVKERRSA